MAGCAANADQRGASEAAEPSALAAIRFAGRTLAAALRQSALRAVRNHRAVASRSAAAAAAASLGQVHRARDRQRRASIIKVQYPGIRAICDADMRQLRRLMPLGRLFGTVHGQRQIGCRWTTPENFRALVLGAAGGIGAALTARCTLTPRSAAAVALSHSTAPPLDFAGATSVHGPQ